MREIELITNQAELEAVAATFAESPLLAIDTEFVRETTYYAKLCLIQVANDELVACVDCLADLDLDPLFGALFRDSCVWVLHSARQDLEVVWQRTGRLPPRLIDTQIAAALLGSAPQIGLEELLAKTLGVELGASYARTDWSRRPLPAPALRYALDDVRFLLPSWRKQHDDLAALGRLEWLEEDSRRQLAEPPVADSVTIWLRLKGARALGEAQQRAALALVRWREGVAQRFDRPRRWILADEALLGIAEAVPRTRDELAATLAVPARFVAKHGGEVLAAVAAASGDAEIAALVREHGAAPIADKQRVKALQQLTRERALALKIEPEILATRRDLAALAIGNPPAHLRDGWRAAALGF